MIWLVGDNYWYGMQSFRPNSCDGVF